MANVVSIKPEVVKTLSGALQQKSNLVKLFRFADSEDAVQFGRLQDALTASGVGENDRFEMGGFTFYLTAWKGGGMFVRITDPNRLKEAQKWIIENLK